MPNTANRNYPYPAGTDAPNGPVQIQALANAVDADGAVWAASPRGFINDTTTGAAVTLSTTSAFASTAAITFAITATRRIRIHTLASFNNSSGVAGRYATRPGYNTGASASIGSFVGVGQAFTNPGSIAGLISAGAEGTALLTAGTYTAYASVQRVSGGAVADTASTFYVAVYDEGAT